jgi:hypothetical protein
VIEVTTKRVLILAAVLILVGACVTILIQGRIIARSRSEMKSGQAYSMGRYLEGEFIPQSLEEKTTDELSEMGGVLWGE